MEKISRWYAAAAVLLLNTLLVLLLFNLLLGGLYWLRDRQAPADAAPALQAPAEQLDPEQLAMIYPGWDPADLAAFLQERGITYEAYEPFTQFKPRPIEGRFVNVSPEGYRPVPEQGPWPPDPEAFNVFVFGGSTTLGIGVPDEQTLPAYLQALLRVGCEAAGDIYLYNFGRSAYFSTQERILFEQLILAGHVPDAAIFIDGLNDFVYWDGIPDLTGRLEHFIEGENRIAAWEAAQQSALKRLGDFFAALPMGRLARSVAARVAPPTEAGDAGGVDAPYDDLDIARQVIERWRGNKALVEAVAAAYEVQTLFVWQPVPTYHYDLGRHLFAQGDMAYFGGHQRSHYGYALMDELRESLALGDNFLWLGDMDREGPLYLDSVHYTAAFSEAIAGRIYAVLKDFVPCP